MIQVLHNQYMATLYNFLSFVAVDRLAYKTTPQTKFNILDGEKLEIWEETSGKAEEKEAENKAGKAIDGTA